MFGSFGGCSPLTCDKVEKQRKKHESEQHTICKSINVPEFNILIEQSKDGYSLMDESFARYHHVKLNDYDYSHNIGDIIVFKEFSQDKQESTGRTLQFSIEKKHECKGYMGIINDVLYCFLLKLIENK